MMSNIPHNAFDSQSQGILGPTMEEALGEIYESLANIDFDRFFRTFPPRSFVYRSMEKFDFHQFAENVVRAFPIHTARLTCDEVQTIQDAKLKLNDQIYVLDRVFIQMEEARFNVRRIRSALLWVGGRNYETFLELQNEPGSVPLNSNPLPAPPRHVHWVSQQFLAAPIAAPLSPPFESPRAEFSSISRAVSRAPSSHSQSRGRIESRGPVSNHAEITRGRPSSRSTTNDVNGSYSSVPSRPNDHDWDESHPPRYTSHTPIPTFEHYSVGRSPLGNPSSHSRVTDSSGESAEDEDEGGVPFIPPPPYDYLYPPEPAHLRILNNITENFRALRSRFTH